MLSVVVTSALQVLFWAVFIQAVLSWLPGAVDSSAWLRYFDRAVRALTGPLIAPIRHRMPVGSAVDFSPLVLLILLQVAIWLVRSLLLR